MPKPEHDSYRFVSVRRTTYNIGADEYLARCSRCSA